MIKVSGTVVSEGIKTGLKGAVVKAVKSDGKMQSAVCDEKGRFTFNQLESGEWTFHALKEGYFASKSQKHDLAADKKDMYFDLALIMDVADEKAGKIFFYVTLGLLVALIAAYIILHILFPGKGGQGSFLWGNEPLRFAEVLFWGVAGVLVDKLMSIGWYLRRGTFYKKGILMHISHIISVPLLVLVVVFLLSLATLSLTLTNGNTVSLDLSDPRILVAVAFILGSQPWGMREFIKKTADKITKGEEEK